MLLVFELVLTYISLRQRLFRYLTLGSEIVSINGRSIESFFSPIELKILKYIVAQHPNPVRCSDIASSVYDDEAFDCKNCHAKDWVPSKCTMYVNLRKNHLARIKKQMELLDVGVLLPAGHNSRRIKEDGWIFRLFDDVRLLKR